MKIHPKPSAAFASIAGWALLLVLIFTPALGAAESSGGFRPTWDLIMRWVNFIILVAIIVKFARRPLADFIAGKRDEIAYQLKRLEEQKVAASARAKEVYHQLDDSRERLERIKTRIIGQGRQRQQEIIDQARSESRLILEGTRRKIDNQLREAKENLRTEMVDSAVDLALERLPQQITAADNQKLLEKYLTETNA